MSLKIIFAWYDCWIGLYYDTKKDCVYLFLIPFVGFKWQLIQRSTIYFQGDGVAFGEKGQYYKWIVPFHFNAYGHCIFSYERVPFNDWYFNQEKKFSIWQNFIMSVRALFPLYLNKNSN